MRKALRLHFAFFFELELDSAFMRSAVVREKLPFFMDFFAPYFVFLFTPQLASPRLASVSCCFTSSLFFCYIASPLGLLLTLISVPRAQQKVSKAGNLNWNCLPQRNSSTHKKKYVGKGKNDEEKNLKRKNASCPEKN